MFRKVGLVCYWVAVNRADCLPFSTVLAHRSAADLKYRAAQCGRAVAGRRLARVDSRYGCLRSGVAFRR